MVGKFDCADDSFCTGGRDIYSVTSVVLRSAADVPTIDSMDRPSASVCWCLVDEHFCARRCNGLSVVIVDAMQLGICR